MLGWNCLRCAMVLILLRPWSFMAYELEPSRSTKDVGSSGDSSIGRKEICCLTRIPGPESLQRDITGLLRELIKNEENTRWQMKHSKAVKNAIRIGFSDLESMYRTLAVRR